MLSLTASVIVNTYNRAPYLRKLLTSLERLVGVDFEIIVVNGPSTDDTEAVLFEYAGRIKIAHCPERNLSLSRNIGIAAASGDIVAFIDDDALPVNELWLENFVAEFVADSTGKLAAVGGPVLHRDSEWYEFDGGLTSDYAFQIFRSIDSLSQPSKRWVVRVPGGNSAFRRDALVQIGGFDEFFVYYLDEADLCFRLAKSGFLIKHVTTSAIRHYAAPSERRENYYDRNWDVITRSDTYFALKNGMDFFVLRLLKTLTYAPQKHYFREINGFWRRGEIGLSRWLRQIRKWVSGLKDGIRYGLVASRKLGDFISLPPPFLPFRTQSIDHRLHIALLTQVIPGQSGNGGIGRYTFDLACALHKRGHNVHIICRDEQPLQYYSLGFLIHGISKADSLPLESESARSVLAKNLGYSLAVQRKLIELSQQGYHFDIVHASNWDAEAAAVIRAGDIPVALMLVSPLAQVIQTEQWEMNEDLRACVSLDRWQIEHADVICVPSYGVLSSYQKLMGIQANDFPNLHLTPLGIVPDQSPFTFVPGSVKRLLFVGRLERRKGAHILLSILPQLLRQFPDWECDLVGNDQVVMEGGTLKEQFLAQHRGAAWLSRVDFRGMVSDDAVKQYYQQCDLFVAPSLFESFGLIYHEAMQYGKAVVGCRTGGVPEVVEDGVEGLLVPPGDAPALAQALAQLMGDVQLRERMGQAGYCRIQERSNYRIMAERLEVAYSDACKGSNKHY